MAKCDSFVVAAYQLSDYLGFLVHGRLFLLLGAHFPVGTPAERERERAASSIYQEDQTHRDRFPLVIMPFGL